MAEATERERIAYDLFAICMQASVAMSDAAKAGEPKAGGGGCWTLYEAIAGYCETDLGVPHASGETLADWREQLVKRGGDAQFTHHLLGAARKRDEEQRRLYAEAMAPRAKAAVRAALDEAKGCVDAP